MTKTKIQYLKLKAARIYIDHREFSKEFDLIMAKLEKNMNKLDFVSFINFMIYARQH